MIELERHPFCCNYYSNNKYMFYANILEISSKFLSAQKRCGVNFVLLPFFLSDN